MKTNGLVITFGKYHDAPTNFLIYLLCALLATCRKAALKDSLQRAIMKVFGFNSTITVDDIEVATQIPVNISTHLVLKRTVTMHATTFI